MTNLRADLQAWKLSGKALSFSEWLAQQNKTIQHEKDNTLPTNAEPVKPKINSSVGRDYHVWLDARVHEKLKGNSISGEINRILRLYYGIPFERQCLEEFERAEKEQKAEQEKMRKLKESLNQREENDTSYKT